MRAIDRRTSSSMRTPSPARGTVPLAVSGTILAYGVAGWRGTRRIPGRGQGEGNLLAAVFVSTPGYHDVSIVG
jgi:hypothetical protein